MLLYFFSCFSDMSLWGLTMNRLKLTILMGGLDVNILEKVCLQRYNIPVYALIYRLVKSCYRCKHWVVYSQIFYEVVEPDVIATFFVNCTPMILGCWHFVSNSISAQYCWNLFHNQSIQYYIISLSPFSVNFFMDFMDIDMDTQAN
jgi:hypothetical protein